MVRRGEFCATLKKVRFCGILYVTNDSFKCYIKVGEPMGENKTPQELDFERKHEEDMRRICDLRLMDDDFMSKVFEDKECAEFLLKIILDRDDLTIQEVHGQHDLNNLQVRYGWIFLPWMKRTVLITLKSSAATAALVSNGQGTTVVCWMRT